MAGVTRVPRRLRAAASIPAAAAAAAVRGSDDMTMLNLVRVVEREVRPPYSHVITLSLGIIAASAHARAPSRPRALAPPCAPLLLPDGGALYLVACGVLCARRVVVVLLRRMQLARARRPTRTSTGGSLGSWVTRPHQGASP